MEDSFVSELVDLGLNSYEARVYIALLMLGEAPAPSIAEAAEVPLTRVYDVLSSLEEKGLIMVVHQRPKLFKAIEPKLALSNLVDIIEARFNAEIIRKRELANILAKKLENIKEKNSRKHAIDTVIIKGKAAVKNKAFEILNNAKNTVRIAGYRPFLTIACVGLIGHLQTRNIHTKVLGTFTKKCIDMFKKHSIMYKRYPFTYSSMIIVDNDHILIVLNPGEDLVALYSQNKELIKAHIEFFERLWREA